LAPVKERVDSRRGSLGLGKGQLAVYAGRYAQKLAHIVFIPWMNKTEDVGKLVDEIRIFLRSGEHSLLLGRIILAAAAVQERRVRCPLLLVLEVSKYDRKPLLNSKWEGKDNGDINTFSSSFPSEKAKHIFAIRVSIRNET